MPERRSARVLDSLPALSALTLLNCCFRFCCSFSHPHCDERYKNIAKHHQQEPRLNHRSSCLCLWQVIHDVSLFLRSLHSSLFPSLTFLSSTSLVIPGTQTQYSIVSRPDLKPDQLRRHFLRQAQFGGHAMLQKHLPGHNGLHLAVFIGENTGAWC